MWRRGIGLAVGVETAVFDAATPTIEGFFEWRSEGRLLAPAFRLGLAATDDAPFDSARSVTLFAAVARFEGCPILVPLTDFLTLQPCAALGLGAVYGAARDLTHPAPQTVFWADAALTLRLRATVGATFLELSGGGVRPLTQPVFGFDDPTGAFRALYSVPPVGAVASFGAGVRFP